MMYGIGKILGWLIVVALAGAILNPSVKLLNKKFSKNNMRLPVKIFVVNHKYFGMVAITLLLIHFIVQFINYGPNLTGVLAAVLLIMQVFLGVNAIRKRKPRKGIWFVAHRIIAVLIIVAVVVHLFLPYFFNYIFL